MITSILLASFATIAQFLISPITLLPDVTLSPDLSNAIANIQGILSTVDPLFPLATMFACLGILVAVELAIFAYKAIYWLIKKIPTIS